MGDTQTLRLKWRAAFRARRAVPPSQFGMKRPDLKTWVARITGLDARFGLARDFLPMVYPIVFVKQPALAVSFDDVRAGDVLEARGQDSLTAPFSAFYRVVSVDETGADLAPMGASEVRDYAQGVKGAKWAGGDDSTSSE